MAFENRRFGNGVCCRGRCVPPYVSRQGRYGEPRIWALFSCFPAPSERVYLCAPGKCDGRHLRRKNDKQNNPPPGFFQSSYDM